MDTIGPRSCPPEDDRRWRSATTTRMTRPAQKTTERNAIADFLRHWADGAEWEMLDEEPGTETPDALLARRDGSQVVGLEMTRYVDSRAR